MPQSEIERFEDWLRSISVKLDDVHTALTGLTAEHNICRQTIERHRHTIEGNGTPGLTQRLYQLEQAIKAPREDSAWLVWLVAAVAVAGLFVGIYAAMKVGG